MVHDGCVAERQEAATVGIAEPLTGTSTHETPAYSSEDGRSSDEVVPIGYASSALRLEVASSFTVHVSVSITTP